jgi:hypothetical protein
MKEESPDGCEAFLPQTPPKGPILLPWYPLNDDEDSGASTPLRQNLAQEESGATPPVNLTLPSKDVAMADTDEPTFKQEESPLATFGVGSLPLSPVTPRSAEKRKASRERAYEPADNKRLGNATPCSSFKWFRLFWLEIANFSDTEELAFLDDTFSQSSLSLGMYCPEFTEAEVFCQETYSLFRSIFAESNYKDDESEYLKMRVAELSEIKYPGRLLVGFVGDSGQGRHSRWRLNCLHPFWKVSTTYGLDPSCDLKLTAILGKSSLINSIMGLDGLAQEVRTLETNIKV